MTITLSNGETVEFLGDPHLGRSFIHGVPLHRRGDREQMVWHDFLASVMDTEADYHVCVGDLFDKAIVPYSVVWQAASIYLQAQEKNISTRYFVLRGNHDAGRDLEKTSAFAIFQMILPDIAVTAPALVDGMLLCPWHPTAEASSMLQPAEIAVGHWDTEFGDHNLIPTERMSELGIAKAFTGHIHLPTEFTRDGVDVTVVGSMQPYSHAEDATIDWYVTVTLEDLRGSDLTMFKDRCLRVLVPAGETFDLDIDCLQLTIKREGEEDEGPVVTLGEFDMDALFHQAFTEEGVPDDLQNEVLKRYQEMRLVE